MSKTSAVDRDVVRQDLIDAATKAGWNAPTVAYYREIDGFAILTHISDAYYIGVKEIMQTSREAMVKKLRAARIKVVSDMLELLVRELRELSG